MSFQPQRSARTTRAGRILLALGAGLLLALICAACGASSAVRAANSALTASVSKTPPNDPLTVVTAEASAADPAATTTEAASTGAATTTPAPVILATQTTPASLRASVRVGGEANVAPTSSQTGFLGIATELGTIPGLTGTPKNPDTAFTQLLKNLSPGVPLLLRLGGDSADWSWWKVPGMKTPEAIRYTMTPAWGADVKALLQALGPKAQAMVGISLELNSKRIAAYEVKEFDTYLGANRIYGFEVGNEPELYAHYSFYHLANGAGVLGRTPATWTMAAYTRDFTNVSAALGNAPIVGPASQSATWLPLLGTMLNELPKRLKLVTVHDYPLKHCSPNSHETEAELLANSSIGGMADQIHVMVQAARAHGKSLRLDETNGITCGGQPGVSNSFGEALWALNVLPALWQAGVSGVNFQTINWNLNNMISATDSASAGWNIAVEPEYYGLLTFADAAPAGAHLMQITPPSATGFYQYAVRSPDGDEHVVLTNITHAARTIAVSAAKVHGTGTVSLLTAKSLSSLGGTTFAGQKLSSSTGELTGAPTYTLVKPNKAGVYAVRVPAHSAAILTVSS